jgi:hypothetical protein
MKATATRFQCISVAAGCVLMALLLSRPRTLPDPVRHGLGYAVDGVARVCLLAWGEPTDAIDDPDAPWDARETGSSWSSTPIAGATFVDTGA